LFETLRVVRRDLAKAQGVPPYVIFHDATLREMAAAKPDTLAALGQISGVGARKLEAYGSAFLDAIASAGQA
jgi:ATP-dependent DNA helicase RecQ